MQIKYAEFWFFIFKFKFLEQSIPDRHPDCWVINILEYSRIVPTGIFTVYYCVLKLGGRFHFSSSILHNILGTYMLTFFCKIQMEWSKWKTPDLFLTFSVQILIITRHILEILAIHVQRVHQKVLTCSGNSNFGQNTLWNKIIPHTDHVLEADKCMLNTSQDTERHFSLKCL